MLRANKSIKAASDSYESSFKPETPSLVSPRAASDNRYGREGSSEQTMKIGLMVFLANYVENSSKRAAGKAEK